MTAVQVRRHGGPEALEVVRLPVPVPSSGEILVRNHWVGLNWVDLQHVAGRPYPVSLPLVPGTEATGEVAALGDRVEGFAVGTPVVHFGHLTGVYAELTAVPADHVVELPAGASLRDVAALALAGTTASVLVHDAGQVRPRQVAVVQAAAGSTGGAVVQLAVAAGATVVGLASSAPKAEEARALGAAHTIVLGPDTDALDTLVHLVGRRADTVFDAGGQDTFATSLDLLGARGTLVLYGQSSGPVSPIDPAVLSGLTGDPRRAGSLGLRWVDAGGDYLGSHAARASTLGRVLDALAAGQLSARVVDTYPLVQASAAHERLAGRGVAGKLLLDCR